MSHTYKDQARYRNKHRPIEEWSTAPWYDESLSMTGTRRKKYYAKQMNRKLRHDWKRGLYQDKYEKLPVKHENIDWMVW